MNRIEKMVADSNEVRSQMLENAQLARDRGDWYVADQLEGMADQLEKGLAATLHRVDQLDAKIDHIESTQAEMDRISGRIRQLKS